MPIHPVPPEHSAKLDNCVVFIFQSPSEYSAIMTEVVSGVDRISMQNMLNELGVNWYLTYLQKCTGSLRVGNVKECKKWLLHELASLSGPLVIGFGKQVHKFVPTCEPFPSWGNCFNNKKNFDKLKSIILEWKNGSI